MTSRLMLSVFIASILSFVASAPAVCAEGEPAASEPAADAPAKPAPKPSKKKPAKKKKPYDYSRSKYKSLEPSQTSAYKFNEQGEPIHPAAKKTPAKKKNRSEPPESGLTDGGACGSADSCAEKKTEADAL